MLPLIAAGIGAGMNLYGQRQARRAGMRAANAYGQEADRYQREHNPATQRLNDPGRNAYMDAINRVGAFDPSAAAATMGQATTDNAISQLQANRRVGDVSRSRRGLFNSGLGEAQMERSASQGLGNSLGAQAGQFAGMQQSALGQVAGMQGNLYAQDQAQNNMYTNNLMGMRGAQIGQRAQTAAESGQAWGSIGGSLMGAGIGAYKGGQATQAWDAVRNRFGRRR